MAARPGVPSTPPPISGAPAIGLPTTTITHGAYSTHRHRSGGRRPDATVRNSRNGRCKVVLVLLATQPGSLSARSMFRPAFRARAARGRSFQRGQSLVELALIAPIMVIILAAALDLGRLFYSQITVTNAAREGALAAAQDAQKFQPGQACTTATANSNRVMCITTSESRSSFVTIAAADVSMSCDGHPIASTGDIALYCHQLAGQTVAVRVVG